MPAQDNSLTIHQKHHFLSAHKPPRLQAPKQQRLLADTQTLTAKAEATRLAVDLVAQTPLNHLHLGFPMLVLETGHGAVGSVLPRLTSPPPRAGKTQETAGERDTPQVTLTLLAPSLQHVGKTRPIPCSAGGGPDAVPPVITRCSCLG